MADAKHILSLPCNSIKHYSTAQLPLINPKSKQIKDGNAGPRTNRLSQKPPGQRTNTSPLNQSPRPSLLSRIVPLQIRVSAPTTGTSLPIILLSHGHGRSNNLSSKSFPLDPTMPGAPLFGRSSVEDMKTIIDQLDFIEEFPAIKGRLDRSKIAVAGHSMGGQTASMLLGTRLTDLDDGKVVDVAEPRIKAGVLLAPPGNGGADLSTFAYEN